MARSLQRLLLVLGVAASAATLTVVPASAAPNGFTIDLETGQLGAIDAGAATVTPIGGSVENVDSLALACDGVLYGVTTEPEEPPSGADEAIGLGDQLVTIDKATGSAVVVGDLGVSVLRPGAGLAFAPNGTLYMTIRDTLYTVNRTTGAATLVGAFDDDEFEFASIAVNAAGTMYGYDDVTHRLYTIDPVAVTATPVGDPEGNNPGDLQGLDFDSAGVLWGIGDPDGQVIVTFDLTTGEPTFDFDGSFAARGLALSSLPCPVPPTTTTTTTTSTTTTTVPTTSTTVKPVAAAVAVVVQPTFTG